MLRRAFSLFSRAIISGLFPPACSFCDATDADGEWLLCRECMHSIKWVTEPFCRQCGRSWSGLSQEGLGICGSCLSSPPSYDTARYGAYYDAELRKAIIRLKFSGVLYLRRTLSYVMIETFERYFRETHFDLIIPVPMHHKRLISRGFNQVVVLGEKLASYTGIRLDRTSLRKVKDTLPQVGLSRAERIHNLKGSMAVIRPDAVEGKSVLLMDDVATSGATIHQAARTLKKAGASQVHSLVLALRPRVTVESVEGGDDHFSSG